MSERFFLYVIDDGGWHNLSEIAEELEWPMDRAVECAQYLAEGQLIHYDEKKKEVRLQEWVRKYPRGEWVKPGKKSTGTVIISKGGTVTLQETVVCNNLDFPIEVGFLVVDEKLKEFLISKLK